MDRTPTFCKDGERVLSNPDTILAVVVAAVLLLTGSLGKLASASNSYTTTRESKVSVYILGEFVCVCDDDFVLQTNFSQNTLTVGLLISTLSSVPCKPCIGISVYHGTLDNYSASIHSEFSSQKHNPIHRINRIARPRHPHLLTLSVMRPSASALDIIWMSTGDPEERSETIWHLGSYIRYID